MNFSQVDFARELGVSQAYYSNIESGKKKISKKLIEFIAKKWPVSQGILQGDEGSNLGGKNGGIVGGYLENSGELKVISTLIHDYFNEESVDKSKLANIQKAIKHYLKLSEGEITENQRLRYTLKLTNDLKDEKPELSEMFFIYSELSSLIIDLENIYQAYIDPVFNRVKVSDSKNYSDYKVKTIKHLESFLEYKKPILPVVNALKKFIQEDFPPLDSKHILSSTED